MLGKLIKYECRATGRVMGIMYAALIVVAVIMRLGMALNHLVEDSGSAIIAFFPLMITSLVYVALIVAVSVLTLVLIIQRFYKNLFKNEGYLMHTLPVETWKNIMSKLVISLIWCVVSMIVVVISVYILGSGSAEASSLVRVVTGWTVQLSGSEGTAVIYSAELIILAIICEAAFILKVYLALACGQLADNHKLLCSFGAYVGISIVLSIISAVLSGISAYVAESTNGVGVLDVLGSSEMSSAGMHISIWISVAGALIKSAVFFIGTNYLMKNKLNLE